MSTSKRSALWIALGVVALAAFFWALPSPKPVVADTTDAFAIRDVRLFDGQEVIEMATVIIGNGTIQAVGTDVDIPEDAEVLDGTGKTLLPGLIDSHTHVFGNALADALRFGVTTEIDMFSDHVLAAEIRQRQAGDSKLDEANLVSAGTLVTAPGGHGTQYAPGIPTLDSPTDAAAFVEDRVAEGSDFIKIIYEDGSLWGVEWDTHDRETLAAIIEAAHAHDKLAVVHVSTLERARDALEMGADGLVHIFADQAPDQEFVEMAAASGAFVTPTLTVISSAAGSMDGGELGADPRFADLLTPDQMRTLYQPFPNSSADYDVAQAAVRALYEAGVPILAGSDTPNPGTAHGISIHHELELLVEAGLTPTEALAAATSAPADAYGLDDRGRIAPGKRADLLLVEGNPTQDITATRDIATLWKDGREVMRTVGASIAPDPVAAPVVSPGIISDFDQGQLAANFGFGWVEATDDRMGGTSTVELAVLPEDGGYYLEITGEIKAGAPYPWAGAMYFPAAEPMSPVNASAATKIAFRARGDGTPGRILVFARRLSQMPAIVTFETQEEWQEYEYPFSAFSGIDGSDLSAILFSGHMFTGTFRLDIDDLELR